MSSPAGQGAAANSSGLLRRVLARLARTDSEVEAQQLAQLAQGCTDCVPIAAALPRQQVVVRGMVRTVTVRPRSGRPTLEAQLYDGSAMLTLCWLGRRRIAGITAGRSLQARGLITEHEGHVVMYNPRYELLSPNEHALGPEQEQR